MPMANRQQTYDAIRKLVASLDDPFTRFLEPERLTALRRGTAGAFVLAQCDCVQLHAVCAVCAKCTCLPCSSSTITHLKQTHTQARSPVWAWRSLSPTPRAAASWRL